VDGESEAIAGEAGGGELGAGYNFNLPQTTTGGRSVSAVNKRITETLTIRVLVWVLECRNVSDRNLVRSARCEATNWPEENDMAQCSVCKAETQLHVNSVPICLKCDDARSKKIALEGGAGRNESEEARLTPKRAQKSQEQLGGLLAKRKVAAQ
jgi:hypothetical protein